MAGLSPGSAPHASSASNAKPRPPPPPRCIDGKQFKQHHGTLTTTLALPRESIHSILRAFETTDRTAVINLRHKPIKDRGACILAEALAGNSHITDLDMTGGEAQGWPRVTMSGCTALAEGLAANRSLTSLRGSWNEFRDEGIASLASSIRSNDEGDPNKTLRVLELARTGFEKAGLQTIGHLLQSQHCVIDTLSLATNSLTTPAVPILAAALIENRTLTWLDVSDNQFKDDGMEHLSRAFRENSTLLRLKARDLLCGPTGCAKLCADLKLQPKASTGLTHLYLDGNKVGHAGCKALADLVSTPLAHGGLVLLSLNRCHLLDEDVQAMSENLDQTDFLQSLLMDDNDNLSDVSVLALAHAFETNRSIVTVSMRRCAVLGPGVKELSDVLAAQDAGTLLTFDLEGNHLTEEGLLYRSLVEGSLNGNQLNALTPMGQLSQRSS